MSYKADTHKAAPTTLIIEGGSSGHLLVYVRTIASQALAGGSRVVVALAERAVSSPEFILHLSEIEAKIELEVIPKALTPGDVERIARRVQADLTVIPHGDVLASKLALAFRYRGPGTLALLVMRDPRWERPAPLKRRLRNLLKLALLKRVSRYENVKLVWLRQPGYISNGSELAAIDPFIAGGTLGEMDEGAKSLSISLSLKPDIFWFLVTGAVTRRKNVPLLIESMERLCRLDVSSRIGLVIVGPLSTESGLSEDWIAERCFEIGVECRIDNRLITNFEMNCAILAADAVVMVYSSHSPNSTLGKAMVLGARLVAAGPPSIRGFVKGVNVGFESELNPDAIASNLLKAMASSKQPPRLDLLTESQFAAALLRSPEVCE